MENIGFRYARAIKRRLLKYHQGPRPNVLIFGIRRGGSTFLADMFAIERGLWFSHEPFAVFARRREYNEKRRWLPELPHSQFFSLSPEQTHQCREYTNRLLNGYSQLGTCRRTKPFLRADRVALKILNAPFMIDWFGSTFDVQLLFLTRHPAAQALSVLRNNWGFSAEAYFGHPHFLYSYMSPEQIDYGREILATGSLWRKAILNWVIENCYPLYHCTSKILRITYEELTLYTPLVVEQLCTRFLLVDRNRMLELERRPSESSRLSTKVTNKMIRSGDKHALVDQWRQSVDKQQIAQAQDILDYYEVDIYHMDDSIPTRSYFCHAHGADAARSQGDGSAIVCDG